MQVRKEECMHCIKYFVIGCNMVHNPKIRRWNYILVGHSLMLVGLILLPDEGHLVRCLLNMAVQTVV